MVCVNYGYQRGHFLPCQQVWHARCFRIPNQDPFPRELVPKPAEDLGDGLVTEQEGWELTEGERAEVEREYLAARPGDHFMTPFQCPLCHFRNIYKRSPQVESKIYKWTLTTIMRASLDAFWSS